jgi:MFS family permease
MSDQNSSGGHGSTTKLIAIAVGTVAALVNNTLPVFLAVIARAHGYSERQSGLIAFCEMGGIALGSTICALQQSTVNRIGWRGVMGIGLAIFSVANICAAHSSTYSLLLMSRTAAGAGAGIGMALTYAFLMRGNGARWLALFNVAQTATGWLAIPCLRPIAAEYGPSGLFYIMAAVGGLAIVMCLMLPAKARVAENAAALPEPGRSPAGNMEIYSVLFFFAGAGAVYAFLAFMGMAWGGTGQAVDAGLSKTMFVAMTSGVCVALMGSRFGFRAPLYVGYTGVLVCMVLLTVLRPVDNFTLLCGAFAASWNVVTPFQFEAVTYVDNSGRAAMLVNACTYGGMAIGPAIGGLFVTHDFVEFNVVAIASCIASVALIVGALRVHDARAVQA